MENELAFNLQLKILIEEKIVMQKNELIATFKVLLGKTSYYNAGEGSSYSNEGSARETHKQNMFSHTASMLASGFTRAELETICRGNYLASETDYLPLLTRIELNEAKAKKENV